MRVCHRSLFNRAGELRHLISVCEYRHCPEEDDAQMPAFQATCVPEAQVSTAQTKAEGSGVVEREGSSDCDESSSSGQADWDDALRVHVAVDGDSMKIKSSSTSFSVICGCGALDMDLMNWIPDTQRDLFKAWVLHANPKMGFGALRLQQTFGEYIVDCQVEARERETTLVLGEVSLVKLRFNNLRKNRKRNAATPRRCRLRRQANSQTPMSKSSSHGDSSSDSIDCPLEAVIDVQASPMKIMSCSPAFNLPPSDSRLDNLILEDYVQGFTAWLRGRIQQISTHVEGSSGSEMGFTLKLRFARQDWYHSEICKSYALPDCKGSTRELPVRVCFYPLLSSDGRIPCSFHAPSVCGRLTL